MSSFLVKTLMSPLMIALIVIIVVSLVGLCIYSFWYVPKKNRELRESIYAKEFIPYQEFEDNWISQKINGRKGVIGYKYNDGPGCYVILIFDEPVTDGDYSGFSNVYIGQSVNICKRVHSHFNGKGNGDVYADVRNGKSVYVQFQSCDKEDMNDLEKSLISAFDATQSYNNTRGGGAKR